jgi:hypothetical protein
MPRRLPVPTGAIAIAGRMRTVIGRTVPLLDDFPGLVARRNVATPVGGAITLIC